MRLDRVRTIFVRSLFAAAVSVTAAPAFAQTPYDGLWQVTIVTKTGSCEASARYPLTVADGKVSAAGADVSGSVGREGNVRVSSPALMQTASSAATADRGSGMGRPAEFHAAADGKRRVNKTTPPLTSRGAVRSLIPGAAVLFAAFTPLSASHAQSGPFAGLAGVWSGG